MRFRKNYNLKTQDLKSQARRGFTIVEILTVLFIVSVGLVGVLSLIIKNIQSQSFNKQNLIAYQLAQEGIELIREVRDTNWKGGEDFNNGLSDGFYSIDYANLIPQTTPEDDPEALYLDDYGYYSHTPSSEDSGFRRLVKIETLDSSSIRVTCSVSWHTRDVPFSYDLETILYDWR